MRSKALDTVPTSCDSVLARNLLMLVLASALRSVSCWSSVTSEMVREEGGGEERREGEEPSLLHSTERKDKHGHTHTHTSANAHACRSNTI